MPLVDVATESQLWTLVSAVPAEQRFEALKGANPRLVAEYEKLCANPRVSRTLSADSMDEILDLVDDAELLESIIKIESRKGIVDKCRKKLRDQAAETQQAPPADDLRANIDNIAERTARALTRTNVIDALSKMSEIDVPQVIAWHAALPASQRPDVTVGLLGGKRSDGAQPEPIVVGDAYQSLVLRVLQGEDPVPFDSMVRFARAIAHDPLSVRAAQSWSGPVTKAVAEYCCNVDVSARLFPTGPLDADAVQVLSDYKRWSTIARLQALPADELAAKMRNADPKDIVETIGLCKSAAYVDAVVALMPEGQAGMHLESCIKQALSVSGISKASRAKLLAAASENLAGSVLAGDIGSPMEHDEVKAFVASFPARPNFSLRRMFWSFDRSTSQAPSATAAMFLDELYESHENVLDHLTSSSYYRAAPSWAINHVMRRVATDLDGIEGAWPLFFSIVQNNKAPLADIVKAVKIV